MDIKRLLVVNVPIKNCNLKCEYCYISALQENEKAGTKATEPDRSAGKVCRLPDAVQRSK